MRRRAALLAAGAVLAGFLTVADLAAASRPEWGLTVLSGIHFGRESAFSDVYGAAIPFGLEVRFFVRRFGLSVGGVTLGKEGTAVSLDGGSAAFPVKIRLTSLPVMALLRLPLGRGNVDLGLGAVRTSYKETWPQGDFLTEGSTWGFIFGVNGGYGLSSRLALFGSLRYLTAPTDRDSLLGKAIDLGGFQALAGVTVRFGRTP